MIGARISSFYLLVLLYQSCLVFSVHAADTPEVKFTVSGFDVLGENPLEQTEIDNLLAPFLGEHTDLTGLLEAAVELESYLLKSGHSFHRVILPPQNIENNRLKLEVVVFKLANIEVTGNKHFSSNNIKASLPGLKSGEVPDTKQLSKELILANGHPSKKTTIRIKQSRTPDSVDAELAVQDQRPWYFFTSLNNIGRDDTGDYRISAGFQHTNLFNLDDSLALSYTTSPGHTSEVKQYGFNYRLPLYMLSGELSFFYSRSDVDNGVIEQVFDVSGAGKFLGGSYTHTFLNRGNYRHRASIGVDDKLFENNISFQNIPIGTNVRTRPLSISYSGEFRFERSNIKFNLAYVRNLRGGALNENDNYAASRLGASQNWEALRFSSYGSYSFKKDWLLTANVTAQYSDEPLISGEQFGIGGVNSVRGFEERAVTGDKGIRFSFEAWTPPLKYDLRLLGFIDTGYVKTVNTPAGQISSETIISLGLGARWYWAGKFGASLDYAHEINDARTANAGGSKLHLNLYYRF